MTVLFQTILNLDFGFGKYLGFYSFWVRVKLGWKPYWQQEGHAAPGLKITAAITLMECTLHPLLFFHCRPFSCLRSIWWDGVKQDVQRGRVKREPANYSGSPERRAIKPACVCHMTCFCTINISVFLWEDTMMSVCLQSTNNQKCDQQCKNFDKYVNTGYYKCLFCETISYTTLLIPSFKGPAPAYTQGSHNKLQN